MLWWLFIHNIIIIQLLMIKIFSSSEGCPLSTISTNDDDDDDGSKRERKKVLIVSVCVKGDFHPNVSSSDIQKTPETYH